MKKIKAFLAFALAVSMCVSTGCGNVSDTAEKVENVDSSEVSQTTTSDTALTAASSKKVSDTSQPTTTTRKSVQTASETSKAKTTTKSTGSSSAVNKDKPQEQTEQQSYYPTTESPREEPQPTPTQEPEVTTQHRQTTTAPQKPVTTTQKPQTTTKQTTTQKPSTTQPQETVEWSESMRTWRKLCEGKNLSQRELDIIRSEILEYAEKFNGQKNIHVSFGIDEYDISYEKPLNMTVREDMTDYKEYAHMDAYVDADCIWLINYAKSEEEIYNIVSETREDCLHLIDYGLFSRWEIFTINNSLKYASDIEFNVGFDETRIWFLTED